MEADLAVMEADLAVMGVDLAVMEVDLAVIVNQCGGCRPVYFKSSFFAVR
jgi:hypothetical protein